MEADAGTGSAAISPEPVSGAVVAVEHAASDAAAVQVEQYADLAEYARSLGIDPDREEDLLWVVQEAFDAPLPGGWTECTDNDGRVFYFNEASNQSTWEHPMDRVYRELLELVLRIRSQHLTPEGVRAAVTDHLREVHQQALASLAGWSGPYPAEQGEYYYNEASKVSVWENPVTEYENELVGRYDVLFRCLLSHLPEGDVAEGPPGVPGARMHGHDPGGHDLLRSLRLDLGMLQRDPAVGAAGPETPHTPYYTARSTDRSARSARRKGESARRSATIKETAAYSNVD